MADHHTNFAYSTIKGTNSGDTTNPGTGTTLTIQEGDGPKFPNPPFNATIWPANVQPLSTNAEIVRVTAIVDDTFPITRTQEGSSSHSAIVGDQIAATITAKTLTDAEAPLTYWAPFALASTASALQTLAQNYTTNVGTNSLYVFPVTVPQNLAFNQILLANSLSYVTSAIAGASNSYYSHYGLYTMNANTVLSLVSSSSFSIGETINSVSLTWKYPTTTATSGWGYGSLVSGTGNLSTTAQMVSYISGTRLMGLQFGGNMTLSGGLYWMGILSLRSTGDTRSTYGLSNAGIIGQPIANINQAGTASGLLPIGFANSNFSGTNASHFTQWNGRYLVGLLTNTVRAGFVGSAIPSAVTVSELAGFALSLSGTVLPSVTFVST